MKERKLYNGEINIQFNDNNHCYIIGDRKWITSVTACTGLLDKPGLKFWACNMMAEQLYEFLDANKEIDVDQLRFQIEEAKKAHTKKARKEADSGTLVHNWAEQFILSQINETERPKVPEDKRVLNGVLAFLKWVESEDVKFVATELLLYSKEHDFAGLMDFKFTLGKEDHKIIHIGDFKTNKAIYKEDHKIIHTGDFKTNKAIYNEMLYQLAGYDLADREESGEEHGDGYILRLDKDSGEFESHIISKEDMKKNEKAFLGLRAVKIREKELK